MTRLFVAFDGLSMAECLDIASVLGSGPDGVKLQEVLDQSGYKVVERLRLKGIRSFFDDRKLHDIPSAVRRRAKKMAEAGADYISVHACEGTAMLEAALEGVRNPERKVEIWGVTVLTSIRPRWARYLGKKLTQVVLNRIALKRALIAKAAGVEGVTCSVKSAPFLSADPRLAGLRIVTPGIRDANESKDDHEQFGTVAEALRGGATDLVIGRPIVNAKDKHAALTRVMREMAEASKASYSQ